MRPGSYVRVSEDHPDHADRYGEVIEIGNLAALVYMQGFGRDHIGKSYLTVLPDRYGVANERFVQQLLYTDTIVYEVVKVTPKTIRIRRCRSTDEEAERENREGNPWPCVWTYVEPDPNGKEQTLRLRADGTYRSGQLHALRPATTIAGRPVEYTDYRE